ncbi:type I-B CRISPR-associated endonuclease Cas1b [Clostridium paridis]|uniref:CRISPR-associated endonuclease Cas1 n=1 Tax=Clostridium paridis TaxID=2803863 RepID=A0A937FGK8_9CLOT|nr:type I-B CRISPR-associated endonuclease Cas1b [Clostridium paridis]MBL4931892.1 type I-B CRISPR-associated endonuclease Cas1 [Clostridium paridis]
MGKDYYIFSNGGIKRKDNTIYFEDEDQIKKGLPIENVERIHLFGEIDLNTKFFNYISQYSVLVNFYNYYGFYSGTYYPRKKNVSGMLVVKQASFYSDLDNRLVLAKSFIDSAIHHILRNLRRHERVPVELIERIKLERENVKSAKDVQTLMGAEGRARKNYYDCFKYILKNDFGFTNRNRRPPKDPLNALISFGNSIIYTAILGELYQTQLDPTISFLHEPSTKRFSLILDISEIFKPLIIDSIIFSSINNKVIGDKDFSINEGVCFLNEDGKKKFLIEFEKKMATTIKHRKLNRNISYRGLIKLECYKLIKHLIEDEKYKPLKAWW